MSEASEARLRKGMSDLLQQVSAGPLHNACDKVHVHATQHRLPVEVRDPARTDTSSFYQLVSHFALQPRSVEDISMHTVLHLNAVVMLRFSIAYTELSILLEPK